MIKVFHSPGSCSDGIVFLMDCIGASYEVEILDLKTGAHKSPSYLATNPKGKVPALLWHDGMLITEFPAIAYWLAAQFLNANLLSEDIVTRVRTLETLEFIVSSIHMRGFTFVTVPQKFTSDPAGQETLREYGKIEAQKGLDHLSEILGDSDYLMGDFSIADCAAYYVLRWANPDVFNVAQNLLALHRRLEAKAIR